MIIYNKKQVTEIKNFYKVNGFVCIKNTVNKKLIDEICSSIVEIYNKYSSNEIRSKRNIYNDKEFHKKLIQLRKRNKKKFGSLYDDLQVTVSSNLLARDPKLLKLASQLLSEKRYNTLAVSGVMTRIDCPFDTRNKLDWHQEHRYYLQNDKAKNGLFMHIPLHDVDENIGSLKLKPKSHNEKLIMTKPANRKSQYNSLNYLYDSRTLDKYESISVNLKKGDIVFVNLDTLHASGFNKSNRIRLSLISRIHRVLSKDFNSYRDESVFISDKIKRDKNNNLIKV